MTPEERQQLESQLSAYLDGELTPQEREAVDAFLAQDADAQALLDELRITAEALKSLPRREASDELLDGLRARMERRALLAGAPSIEDEAPETRGPVFSWLGKGIAAAAVIGLTVTAVVVMEPWAGDDLLPSTPLAMNDPSAKPREPLDAPGITEQQRKQAPPESPLPSAASALMETETTPPEPPPVDNAFAMKQAEHADKVDEVENEAMSDFAADEPETVAMTDSTTLAGRIGRTDPNLGAKPDPVLKWEVVEDVPATQEGQPEPLLLTKSLGDSDSPASVEPNGAPETQAAALTMADAPVEAPATGKWRTLEVVVNTNRSRDDVMALIRDADVNDTERAGQLAGSGSTHGKSLDGREERQRATRFEGGELAEAPGVSQDASIAQTEGEGRDEIEELTLTVADEQALDQLSRQLDALSKATTAPAEASDESNTPEAAQPKTDIVDGGVDWNALWPGEPTQPAPAASSEPLDLGDREWMTALDGFEDTIVGDVEPDTEPDVDVRAMLSARTTSQPTATQELHFGGLGLNDLEEENAAPPVSPDSPATQPAPPQRIRLRVWVAQTETSPTTQPTTKPATSQQADSAPSH